MTRPEVDAPYAVGSTGREVKSHKGRTCRRLPTGIGSGEQA